MSEDRGVISVDGVSDTPEPGCMGLGEILQTRLGGDININPGVHQSTNKSAANTEHCVFHR